ncbi:MAG: 30S ribosome-binding factor RbfA [bacterium]|nr:30S ribosome-binding factor RbfA [bacterium]
MDPYKLQRQNAAIRKVLGELLAVEVKDPRVGFVTISGVELNRDQTVAEVFVSVLGGEQERKDSLAGLKKARGFLQGRLSDLLRLRATPDLRFIYDESLDQGLGVETILDELSARGEFVDEAERRRRRTLDSLAPPPDLLAALAAATRIWVAPHVNPDPDAMGSALALAEALRETGREAEALRYAEAPAGCESLPGYPEALDPAAVAAALADGEGPDLVVTVDCHHLERTGDYAAALAGVGAAWCIDHHLDGNGPAPLPGWIEPVASSASLLVLRVIESLAAGDGEGAPAFALNAAMATNLYAGLYTDTGGFRFPNTLPLSFEAAGRLVAAGADAAEIAERTLHERTPASLALLARVLDTFEYHHGGRLLSLRVTRAMLAATGTVMADTEQFTGLASAVRGVRFVVFLKEREDGAWRVSLRTDAAGDVHAAASRRGGGGHRQAAGCTVAGDPATLVAELAAELAPQLD